MHRWTDPQALPAATADADLALLPLTESALLLTALAEDTTILRRRLEAALAEIEEPGDDPIPARAAAHPDSRPQVLRAGA